MNYNILSINRENNIEVVTFNRLEKLNALSNEFFDELDYYLKNTAQSPDLRGIIFTGSGKAFVAGADISEMINLSTEEAQRLSKRGQQTFNSITKLSVPVLAAVNGFALGGGLELAMACDIRIASTTANFGQPEVTLGLIPGYAGTQRLARLVGLGNALLILMTGDSIPADEAYRIGLVQKVTTPENLMEEALRMAKRIASRGKKAVKIVKKTTRRGLELTQLEGEKIESDYFASTFSKEGKEGMQAFLEKRKPNWE